MLTLKGTFKICNLHDVGLHCDCLAGALGTDRMSVNGG